MFDLICDVFHIIYSSIISLLTSMLKHLSTYSSSTQGQFFDFDKYKPTPPPSCSSSNFNTGTLNSIGAVCTIVPALANQPGTPEGADANGVFCTQDDSPGPQIGPYTLEFDTVPLPIGGNTNLIRVTLDLGDFTQKPAPNGDRRLSEEEISDRRLEVNPLLKPNVNGGSGKPSSIVFQGTFSPDCTFRAVSTQGGLITGNLDYWTHGHDSVSVDFTQSGQVTSPISSLGGQFTDVTGLFVSNFAFAFSASFDDHI